MRTVLTLPLAIAPLWMILARQFSVEGFVVGFVIGLAIVVFLYYGTSYGDELPSLRLTRIPGQLWALAVYIVLLGVDVFFSGVDVGRRLLTPGKLPIDPAVQKVYTQDESNNSLISALSAHSITITPGELVVDFEQDEEGRTIMLVHTLDKGYSTPETLRRDQERRLKLIKRVLGYD